MGMQRECSLFPLLANEAIDFPVAVAGKVRKHCGPGRLLGESVDRKYGK